MRNKPAIELKYLIDHLSSQINQLKINADLCDRSSQRYNRLIIQRANARKKFKELQSDNLVKFFVKKFSKPKEKLICDYFGK